jgi:abortive infection bacteriophage resistance protein
MATVKEFADIEKQVRTQTERNLIIRDQEMFKDCLLSYNYFEIINGFESLLLVDKADKSKGYIPGTTFDDFLNLYKFDMELNTQIMKSLMYIERKLKARVSYHFCDQYCKIPSETLNYLVKSYYDCPAITTYSGKYLSGQYNNDVFVFFAKFDQWGNRCETGSYNYVDSKRKIEYINTFTSPPLWVIIKQLSLNDLYVLTGLLKKPVLDNVLSAFHLASSDREYFLNCLDIFKSLRNHCAHFELVNRFRTSSTLNLNMICAKHTISPKRMNNSGIMNRIGLYDTLVVLSHYTNVNGIIECIQKYISLNTSLSKDHLSDSLLDRMGCTDIKKWEQLIK